MQTRKMKRREPSGLCRYRHHDRCTLNSIPMLTAEMLHHVIALERATTNSFTEIRNTDVYQIDKLINELWLVRSRMAMHANRNGSLVDRTHSSSPLPDDMGP